MSTDIWIVTVIVSMALLLLITEKIPVGRTAIGIMVLLALSGVLTPEEAASGFANPALITVAAMFMLSRGMIRTGSVAYIAGKVLLLSRGNRKAAIGIVLLLAAAASAFINNTPVVVLFIPLILSMSCDYEFSPSKVLIPLSYVSILAGTCTLIGTSTNIIVSDLSALRGYGAIGMFELAGLGIPIAILGLFFLMVAAPRLLPEHVSPVCEMKNGPDRRYMAELVVSSGSSLIGQELGKAFIPKYPSLKTIEVIRNSTIIIPTSDPIAITDNDILLVKGSADDLMAILQDEVVELAHAEEGIRFEAGDEDDLIVELLVPPQSSLIGSLLEPPGLQGDPDIHIIAIKSRGIHYMEQKIEKLRLRVGDTILARISAKKLDNVRNRNDLIIVEDVHHAIIDKARAGRALLIFAAVVVAATTGVANIMVCALTGVFLMAMSGCMRLRDAYRSLEPDVLLLIVGTIALGTAMEKTGASEWYAGRFLGLFSGAGPGLILAAFIILTSISTQVLSNNATAVLLMPIAISTALALGVNPKSFIMGVCFGASACFATPIGYQTNLLVYGPGGYRFSDYLKLGIPLNVIVVAMASVFVPVIWPF